MLKDITKITQIIFDQFITENKPLKAPKAVYDLYRALGIVIDNSKLVSEHYLALDFSEGFLENSSWGEPGDKWRKFFNEDLESLNAAVKKYLHKLNYLCLDEEQRPFSSFMSELYNCKASYSFVREQYNVGFVEPCSFIMISKVLDTKFDNQRDYIGKFSKTDLTSYEQRVALQTDIREKTKVLQNYLEDLKSYIQQNYTLDDLL